jgi:phytoene desaturase (3,4-didehydrolycopene-forming)
LIPIGHLNDDTNGGLSEKKVDFDALVNRARNIIIDIIETRTGVKDFRDAIGHEIYNNPLIWKDRFNLDRGGILGLSHDFWWV